MWILMSKSQSIRIEHLAAHLNYSCRNQLSAFLLPKYVHFLRCYSTLVYCLCAIESIYISIKRNLLLCLSFHHFDSNLRNRWTFLMIDSSPLEIFSPPLIFDSQVSTCSTWSKSLALLRIRWHCRNCASFLSTRTKLLKSNKQTTYLHFFLQCFPSVSKCSSKLQKKQQQ